MRRNKQKIEKIRLCVSIPADLLNECDLYVENYSAFFTACLKNKLAAEYRKQEKMEEESYKRDSNIIQTKRSTNPTQRLNYSTLPQNTLEEEEEEYEKLLYEFNKMRARKEQ